MDYRPKIIEDGGKNSGRVCCICVCSNKQRETQIGSHNI
jgi:hypothetical protein